MPMPTPGGVPVVMTSPGISVMNSAEVADQGRDVEDHGAVLPVCMRSPLTSSHIDRFCGVADLVGRDQPGADRAEGVAALALVPGAAALDLVLALATRR